MKFIFYIYAYMYISVCVIRICKNDKAMSFHRSVGKCTMPIPMVLSEYIYLTYMYHVVRVLTMQKQGYNIFLYNEH